MLTCGDQRKKKAVLSSRTATGATPGVLVKLGSQVGSGVTLAAHTDLSETSPAGLLDVSFHLHLSIRLSCGGKLFGHLTHGWLGPGLLLGLLENRAACLFLAKAGWS